MSVNNDDVFSAHIVKRYILDPSVFVYGGIGKIKQWVDATRSGNLNADLIFYVPIYTLKELDFLKKVFNHSIAANVRESLKFIDNQISNENVEFDENLNDNVVDENGNDNGNDNVLDFESYNREKLIREQKCPQNETTNLEPKFQVTFILEEENNIGPDWKITSGYRRSTPLISDLPTPINGSSKRGQLSYENGRTVVGVFGNNIPGTFNMSIPFERENDDNYNSIKYNNINNNLIDKNSGSEKARIPIRLKYLIRSCVQKQYIENKDKKAKDKINWVVICEDTTTTIWLKSFGIPVENVNEVQKELEQLSTVSSITGSTRSTSPSIGEKVLFDPVTNQFKSADELTLNKSNKKQTKSNKSNTTVKGRYRKGKSNKNTKKISKSESAEAEKID